MVSQVNYHARCYHLSPFTALNVMYNVSKTQVTKVLSNNISLCHLVLLLAFTCNMNLWNLDLYSLLVNNCTRDLKSEVRLRLDLSLAFSLGSKGVMEGDGEHVRGPGCDARDGGHHQRVHPFAKASNI